MDQKHSKKLVLFDILQILKQRTDAGHTLSQHKIQELLESEYGIVVDRKTVRRHLSALHEADEHHIRYKNGIVRTKEGQKQNILTGWYYHQDFTEGELRLLIDSVLFCDALPDKYRLELIEKLEALANFRFRSIISHIDMDVYHRLTNSEFFLTLENIEDAIESGCKVTFCYQHCETDGKLHRKIDENGEYKRYSVSPYQIIQANGHSYLVCHAEGREGLSHFRIDRIVNSVVSEDQQAKKLRSIPGFEAGMRLSEYLTEHPNLWSGEPDRVTFLCPQSIMNDVVDAFGTKVQVFPQEDGMMRVRVRISEDAMFHWALQFADVVEIIKPERLRVRMAEVLREALRRYEEVK